MTDTKTTPRAGKFYRTRDGRKARIYATDGSGNYPVHGALLCPDGWMEETWQLDGRNYGGEEKSRDLISEWIERPEWPAGMPAWAQWVAMDENGVWYWYQRSPQRDERGFNAPENLGKIPPDYAPKWTGDWRESSCSRLFGSVRRCC